jgi:trans-2,3-dihydro-3-hydroxyanthranilate isomerase
VTGTLWAGEPETDGRRRYLIADVFTSKPLEGNPLAVFLDGRDLETEQMQRTARELNLSETVFFLPPERAGPEEAGPEEAGGTSDARVRIFTPRAELPFAGHPILGSAFVLAELLGKGTIRLETKSGVIPVEVDAHNAYGEMEQPLPVPEPYERAGDLLDALNASTLGLTVYVYRNGPRHAYVEFPTREEVAGLKPDLGRLADHPAGISCFAGDGVSWKTRVFVPHLGVPEDPATGSAAGPLAFHLVRQGKAPLGEQIEISQGTEIGRPSRLYARATGTAETLEHVYVGGSAIVVARGEYRLH